jgi:hypothetical protein
VVPFRVLSRRVSSYLSRRSTLNCRFFNDLQPLESLFTVPVLCFQWLAASFSKTPGVGYTHDPRPFGISNIQALSLRSIHNLGTLPLPVCHRQRVSFALCFHNVTNPFPRRPARYPPLFSWTYKSVGEQPLSFHIHTKPPGCHPRDLQTLRLPAFRFLPIQFFRPDSAQVGDGANRPLCGFPIHSGEVS